MSKSQREKGKAGEREVATLFQDRGFNAYRTEQRTGKHGDADVKVEELKDWQIEVKRRENLNVFDTIQQTQGENPLNRPLLFWRKDRKDWLAIMDALDALSLLETMRKIATVYEVLEKTEKLSAEDWEEVAKYMGELAKLAL
jgi:Holliday junction resolvase